jgi:hypothetical protein
MSRVGAPKEYYIPNPLFLAHFNVHELFKDFKKVLNECSRKTWGANNIHQEKFGFATF